MNTDRQHRFDSILKQYANNIYRVAWHNTKNTTEAQDIVEKVFLSYSRALKNFDSEEQTKEWLERAALNFCHNMSKNQDKENTAELSDAQLNKEFLLKLSEKMASQAGDGTGDPEKLLSLTSDNKNNEKTVFVPVENERSKRKMLIKAAAAAAAAILVFAASVFSLRHNRSRVYPDSSNDILCENTRQTKVPQLTQKKTQTKKQTSTHTQTQTQPQTSMVSQIETTVTTKAEKKYSGPVNFASQDELESFVNDRTAEGSPLIIGYEAAGYSRIYSQFYNVNFTDEGYTCTVLDPEARRNSPPFIVYTEDTTAVRQVTKIQLTEDELSEFSRLITEINRTAGEDNYYIHDIYKSDISKEYQTPDEHVIVSSERSNLYAEIVLKDYYEKYKKYNYNKEDFIVSYMIDNRHFISTDIYTNETTQNDVNSKLSSEYSSFDRLRQFAQSFLDEFNNQYSDIAATIGGSTCGSPGCITQPQTSWVRNTESDDAYFRYHLHQYSIPAYSDEDELFDQMNPLYICLYFRPGTSESTVTSKLAEMKLVLDKYNVIFLTTDVLNDDSDFDRIKDSGGYIPDMLINSSSSNSSESSGDIINRYRSVSKDFNSWSNR